MSLNKILLIGNVGKTPEIRTVGDSKVAQFNLATTERFKGKDGNVREETEWHNVSVWGKPAEFVEKYVDKGSQIYVEGRIKTEKYQKDGQDRFVVRVVASSVQLLGGKREGSEQKPSQPTYQNNYGSTPMPMDDGAVDDNDLPFD